MTDKSDFGSKSRWYLSWVTALLLGWFVLVLVLGAWWGTLVIQKSSKIVELERALSLLAVNHPLLMGGDGKLDLARVKTMIYYEWGTFLILVGFTTGTLIWIYVRDLKRTHSLHEFFASLTHELRTPLTSIRLQAEAIGAASETNSQTKLLVRRLLEDTQRLESQVDRTLELARVEGNSTVYSEQVRLKPFLSKLLGRVNEVSGEELELLIDFGKMGDAYSVQADPRSIEVIIRNLIENSIRHSKRDRVQVVVSLSECEGKCLLKYKDNGSAFGGPIRSLGELFKKGPGSKGAGVGLYLVRVLMARMEGSAAFKPEQDGFCVELAFRTGAES